MKITLWRGAEAERLLEQEAFITQWRHLYDDCRWATAMQSYEFVHIWSRCYSSRYELLLVTGTDDSLALGGLLLLAVHKETGRLVVAGDQQAEYQTWLARSEADNEFIQQALEALRAEFSGHTLRFLFLAPSTPLAWLQSGGEWAQQCELRPMPRPLMDIGDGELFKQSLRKKGNRSRIKQLERHGALNFVRLTAPEQLGEALEEIGVHGNFRLSAVHNLQSEGDPLKKPFLLALMRDSRLVHATILKVGDQLASAQINLHNRDEVVLGISTHSPFFARYSPSKFHTLLLGIELAKEGTPTFDLTPGGEYKDRHATRYDEVHVLTVFFKRSSYTRYKTKRRVIGAGKSLLAKAGVERERAFEIADLARYKFARLSAANILKTSLHLAQRKIYDLREMRIYAFDVEQIAALSSSQLMKRNCVADLLKYQPTESWQPTVGQFHREALKRLEAGNSIYTFVEQERLLHYGWLIERQEKSFMSEVGQHFYPLPDSALLFDFYTHVAARGKRLYQQSLPQMLHDAARIPQTKRVYISVLADNAPSRHVIEKAGFAYQYSFFEKVSFGRARCWSNAPEEVTKPRHEAEDSTSSKSE